jgi:hypothetical protein
MRRPSPALVLSCIAVFHWQGHQERLAHRNRHQGPAGNGGPAGVAVSYRLATQDIPAQGAQFVYALCPAGQVPTGGSYRAQEGLDVQYDKFGDFAGGNPDSWVAVVQNPTEAALAVTVEVACVAPGSVSGF